METAKSLEELRETIRRTAQLPRYCGVRWLTDDRLRMITFASADEAPDPPCPLAPGCVGKFLRASTMKKELAVVLGCAYTKQEARTKTINYLRAEQKLLLRVAKEEKQEELDDISDVEIYINGEISHRQVVSNSEPWDETLPDI